MALDFLTGCFGWRPTKLSRASEKHTRGWIWALKLVLVIPCAIAAFGARDSYLRVQRHPELSQEPYNENVRLSLLLTYIGGIAIFPWLFISSALLLQWQGPWILLYGLVDFGLAITLAVGVGLQAEFLPGSFKGCNFPKVEGWQVAPGQKSMFALAAELDGNSTAKGVCKGMVSAWTLAVSTLFFQMLVAYVGIFFDEREWSILNPMRPVVWLIVALIGPPIIIHDRLFPKIRLTFSYLKKTFFRMQFTRDVKIEQPPQFKPPYEFFQVSNPKLMDVLIIEHVLLNIVDYMHYEDVVNFSLVSRAVREAVFPPGDLVHRVPKLKERCCEAATKKGCLYCNKRICFWCKAQRFLPGLPGRRHVTTCQPYCRKCYYHHFARHPRGYKKPCKCRITDRSHEFQDMCRACASKDPVQMQTIRHKRYQQEARDIGYGRRVLNGEAVKVFCGCCKGELKSGIRWWVCGKCKGECRDAIHPPYVGKRRDRDVESGENEDEKTEEAKEPWWRKWSAL